MSEALKPKIEDLAKLTELDTAINLANYKLLFLRNTKTKMDGIIFPKANFSKLVVFISDANNKPIALAGEYITIEEIVGDGWVLDWKCGHKMEETKS